MVGNHDTETAAAFMKDLASWLSGRIQLTTDGLKKYVGVVAGAFGDEIDYAMPEKLYGSQG